MQAAFKTNANIKTSSTSRAAGQATPQVDKIVKSFNTWAFKREQPADAQTLTQAVAKAERAGKPIEFVLYWGKGPRADIAAPDLECLDYLAGMGERIADVYAPGAAIRLIFTDSHAALNGHATEAADSYFGAVEKAADERGFLNCRLNEIVRTARAMREMDSEEVPSGAVLNSLVTCAAKWYRGEGSTEEGALEYFRMNMIEKRAVETVYPDAIFVTFNNGDFRDLFPAKMPIFYMYSLRRGVGVKPWFMTAEPASPAC